MYFSYSAWISSGDGSGTFAEEFLDGNLDELGRDTLVLVAIGPEDVVGSDQRRAEQPPHLGQADLVGDVGQELLAADPVVETAQQRSRIDRGSSGRSVICLRNSLPTSGPPGCPSRSASCWRIKASTRSRSLVAAERMRADVGIQLRTRTCWPASAARASR